MKLTGTTFHHVMSQEDAPSTDSQDEAGWGDVPQAQGSAHPGQSTKESAAGRICLPTASLSGLKLFSLSPLPQQTQFSRSWGSFGELLMNHQHIHQPPNSPNISHSVPPPWPPMRSTHGHFLNTDDWTLPKPTRAEFLEVVLKQMYAGKSPWGILRCITIRNHQCH